MRLDELATWIDCIAHQHVERAVRLRRVLHRDEEQCPVLGVHCRLPQLGWVHFAQTLVTLQSRLFTDLFDNLIFFFIGVYIFDLILIGNPIKRRLRNVEMTIFDQGRHIAEEERQQQGADVTAIHVRVSHDDYASIAQTFEIEVIADARAQRGDQRLNFIASENFIETGAFRVHDLAA